MNHAANNIEAKSKTLKDLLKERKYQVKYFQREYKWEKEHIEDLIIDLERSFFSNYKVEHSREDVPDYDCYYMGPVVLYREKSAFVIVDGQQRLTSFSLLLIFLNHIQKETFKKSAKKIQNLDEYIYSKPYEKETFNLEIPEREAILQCLFENTEPEDSDLDNESSRNIWHRYADIEELFPPTLKSEHVLPVFINWLVEKLIFIEILAQTSESAYTIFETMNDRGLNLTQSEMLKSYLLSNVRDESKIRELDIAWKQKISVLKSYAYEEDLDFFRAWMRAKYAVTIRLSEKGAANEDFEKISTRFHNWAQDNHKKLLYLDTPDDFYYFVQSDFQFFSDIYLKLLEYERNSENSEHTFRLISYKGISPSLSYPLILASLQKIDEEKVISEKIETTIRYLDSYAVYRLLLNDPITHSSIRNSVYSKIKEIRSNELGQLKEKLKKEIDEYKTRFLKEIDYIPFNMTFCKYILSRIYKQKRPDVPFENVYFQRRKDSYSLYQFLSYSDVEKEVHEIPKGLMDLFTQSLCSFCIVPRDLLPEVQKMTVIKRISFLLSHKLLPELDSTKDIDAKNLKDFFIKRNKALKESIISIWKL